jgi:hypothetical protein
LCGGAEHGIVINSADVAVINDEGAALFICDRHSCSKEAYKVLCGKHWVESTQTFGEMRSTTGGEEADRRNTSDCLGCSDEPPHRAALLAAVRPLVCVD